MPTVDTYTVSPGLAVLLADLGTDPAAVLRRAGLPPGLLTRQDSGPATLLPRDYFGLWEAFEKEAGGADLPVRAAEAFTAEAFEPPLFAALCSPSLDVAAARVATYKRLIGPMRLHVTPATGRTAGGTVIRYEWPAQPPPPASLVLAELLFWVALARIATRTRVVPLHAAAPHPPADPEACRRYLGVPVEHGDEPSITFAARDATRPFVTVNEPMWRFFEPELGRRLEQRAAGAPLAERVRAALLELLPAGTATMQAVARRLAVSTRTLQRRLREEGTTYQAALQDTREALARHYLARSALPAAEIAFLLGYEDPHSFSRAFQHWTGQSPQQLRAGTTTASAPAAGADAAAPS